VSWMHSEHADYGFEDELDTREEAIAEGRATYEGTFYVADFAYRPASSYLSDLVEDMVENAASSSDELGDWPHLDNTARAELQKVAAEWVDAHVAGLWECRGTVEEVSP